MKALSLYLDTNAIIAFVENRHESLGSIFAKADRGMFRLVTSQLTLAEVLVRPIRDNQTRLIELYDELLSEERLLDVTPIDRSILRKSAELRVELNQKLPDSIHVATAILTHCDILISSDKRLRTPDWIQCVAVSDLDIDDLEARAND